MDVFLLTRIMGEIRDLVKNPFEGVRYTQNDEDTVSEIHAVIDGPGEYQKIISQYIRFLWSEDSNTKNTFSFATEGTPFVGGCFRLKLVIPREYPNAPPRGFFLTKIYHPNVADNGDICVNTLKKDWTTEVTLKHIFQVIRCLLIVPFPESSLNCEAGNLIFLCSLSLEVYCSTLSTYTRA